MSYAGPSAPGRLPFGRSATPARQPRGVLIAGTPATRRAPTPAIFAAGIILGAALGAGFALLFAPQSGQDARRSIARRGRKLSRRGHDAWDDLRDELARAARRHRRRHRDDD